MLLCIVVCNLAGLKIIIQPKGSADFVSFKRKRRFKLIFAKLFLRSEKIIWLSSSNRESDILRRIFKTENIYSARYFLDKPLNSGNYRTVNFKSIKLIYLARLNWKKGLLEFIEKSRNYNFNQPIEMDVYGDADTSDYMNKLLSASIRSPLDIQFKGWVELGDGDLYADYHYYLLPTFGENFGISILEAISTGTPVLTTSASSWDIIEEKRAGRVFTDIDGILEYLSRHDFDQSVLDLMRSNARVLSKEYSKAKYEKALTEAYQNCTS